MTSIVTSMASLPLSPVVSFPAAGSNPEYAFLTPGGTDHGFFRWALLATGCGIPVEQPPPKGFVPPPPPQQQPAAVVPSVQQQAPQFTPPQQQQQQFYAGAGPQPPPLLQQQQQQQQPYLGQPAYPQHAMHYQPHHAGGPPLQPPARPAPPPIAPEVAAGFSQVLDNLSGSKVRDRQTCAVPFSVLSGHVWGHRHVLMRLQHAGGVWGGGQG